MAQRIVKNQTDTDITIDDLGAKLIPAYGEIDLGASFQLAQLSNSGDLIIALTKNIQSNGFSNYLILNDGSQDLEATDAVDLIRNIYQRTNLTADGDWKVVVKKPSTISKNKVVDKSCLAVLEAQTDFKKHFYIPNGKTWYIEGLGGGSDQTPVRICLFYEENDHIFNFFVDPQHDFELTLNQQAESGDLTLYVNNTDNELDLIEPNRYYRFAKYNDPTQYVDRKITSVDSGSNAITIDQALGDIYQVGSYIALIQKSLRSITVQQSTVCSVFSSPLKIVGTGNNAMCLCIRNLSPVNYTTVNAYINGYEE